MPKETTKCPGCNMHYKAELVVDEKCKYCRREALVIFHRNEQQDYNQTNERKGK